MQRAQHGGGEGNGPSGISTPSVSADGTLVAFDSEATNLERPSTLEGLPVLADTNGVADIFVHDVRTRLNRRITTTVTGGEANGPSRNPAISGDGRYVAFESDASNLVTLDLNETSDVFITDTVTGVTVLVSRSFGGTSGNAPSRRPAIDGSGKLVTFESDATNLARTVNGAPELDVNGFTDVFVTLNPLDARARTLRVSRGMGASANGPSTAPSISTFGNLIAFASSATNLVPGDANGVQDVFVVHDPIGDPLGRRISLASTGMLGQANGDSRAPSVIETPSTGRGLSFRYVAFESDATNLTEQRDLNGAPDVFARDLNEDQSQPTLISRGMDGAAKGASHAPTASGAGLVAFVSDAFDLIGGLPPTSAPRQAIYLADLTTGKVESVSADAGVAPDGPSYEPGISADGLFIAYASDASNLVLDDTNGVRDLFGRIDERRCANGASETGPASSVFHDLEPDLGSLESPAHSVSCQIAARGA